MFRLIILIAIIFVSKACIREPSIYHSKVFKTPGDNGFEIKISENPDKYIPGHIYTLVLMGSRTYDKLQHFRRFTINVESADDPDNKSPQNVGSFQLFRDSLSKFNEDCVNTISETNDLPKTEVFFMWTAPPPGSGCVAFRAMVFEDANNWFADDGKLTKIFCERNEENLKFDENDCCACDEAKYNLIFEGIWSKETHPKDFPFSLWLTHFSDIIGASHEKNFSFWGEGQIASEGFKSLAEWGSVRLLESELKAKSMYLRTIIKAAGLWYPKVNTNTSTTFRVDRRHHLMSLASMFGPTPDWVVGVNGLNLCLKNCSWIENLVVDLYPYDAGTDDGITYMSPNIESKPKERMYRITTKYPEDPRAPFYDPTKDEMIPLAKIYLKREKLIAKSCDENFLHSQIDFSENTEDTDRAECAVTEYSNWSDCSVTCGKGLRMRTREYKLPQKAAMFNCNRQLISKEMCVADIPQCDEKEQEDSEEKLENNEGLCATWPWGPWSECSATCGVGFIARTRQFKNPLNRKKCSHVQMIEREKCMEPPCTGKDIEIPDPLCPVSDWSEWSPCSVTCGNGLKVRTRLLLLEPQFRDRCNSRKELIQQRPCNVNLDCKFNISTAKEVCKQESVQGPCTGVFERWYFDSRKMECIPFIYGGCRGNRNNFLTEKECLESCRIVIDSLSESTTNEQYYQRDIANPLSDLNSNNEPVDCEVSKWSEWSECNASCGLSFKKKTRTILRPAQFGGKECPKRLKKLKKCFVQECQ